MLRDFYQMRYLDVSENYKHPLKISLSVTFVDRGQAVAQTWQTDLAYMLCSQREQASALAPIRPHRCVLRMSGPNFVNER